MEVDKEQGWVSGTVVKGIVWNVCGVCIVACFLLGGVAVLSIRHCKAANRISTEMIAQGHAAARANVENIRKCRKLTEQLKEITAKYDKTTQLNKQTKPEKKFGLPEIKRKQIFQEYTKAEDRAIQEEAAINGGYQVLQSLEKKYKEQIARKYNITRQQLEQISMEGIKKHWAMPAWGP